MARKRERAFALFGAGLFLLTSSALTIAIIVQNVSSKNDSKKAATSQATKPEVKKVNPNKLEGTKLVGFEPTASIPELQKIDTTPGTGDEVKPGATVTVDYTGAVAATGVIFQSSKDSGQQVTFPLSQVIPGWTQGVPGMKAGGTRRLLIPAKLAYGGNPPQGSGIPANADLVFDITVSKVAK